MVCSNAILWAQDYPSQLYEVFLASRLFYNPNFSKKFTKISKLYGRISEYF